MSKPISSSYNKETSVLFATCFKAKQKDNNKKIKCKNLLYKFYLLLFILKSEKKKLLKTILSTLNSTCGLTQKSLCFNNNIHTHILSVTYTYIYMCICLYVFVYNIEKIPYILISLHMSSLYQYVYKYIFVLCFFA